MNVDPLAARGSRQPCPDCGKVGTMTLGHHLEAKQIGDFSLAGGQMKVSAIERFTITCDPSEGGCGWTRLGRFHGGHFVAVDKPA